MAHVRNADHLSRSNAKAIGDLARLVSDSALTPEKRSQLADDIARRTAAQVERLDAEAVADKLEITVKE